MKPLISCAREKEEVVEKFVWKDSFCLGIDEIDNQHRHLLDVLNTCKEKSEQAQGDSFTPAFLEDMKNYADIHFKTEEALMKQFSYPQFDAHYEQHVLFRTKMAELEEAVRGGKRNTIVSLTDFLSNWYIDHIMEYDQKIRSHMLQRLDAIKPNP